MIMSESHVKIIVQCMIYSILNHTIILFLFLETAACLTMLHELYRVSLQSFTLVLVRYCSYCRKGFSMKMRHVYVKCVQ